MLPSLIQRIEGGRDHVRGAGSMFLDFGVLIMFPQDHNEFSHMFPKMFPIAPCFIP